MEIPSRGQPGAEPTDHQGLAELVAQAAPRPDADAARALAAARAGILGRAATSHVGRYAIGAPLGQGGMGEVFRARDERLARDVAIKLIKSGLSSDALQTEALALAQLSHANIVRVFDVGRTDEDDELFVVMELVVGITLRTWLVRDTPSWPVACEVFVQIARGIAAAHRAGIVHGDIKPSNVMIDAGGCAKLLDFGLARWTARGDTTLEDGSGPATTRGGTPRYMAPELVAGEACDERSDQYAFFITLRDAIAGRTDVPRRVLALVARGLSARPTDRWPDMDAVADRLATPRTPLRRWVAVSIGAASLGVASLGALRLAADPNAADGCAPARLAWDSARSDQLRLAFVAADRPWSEDTSAWTLRQIDGHVLALHGAAEAACEIQATDRAPVVACLEVALADLDHTALALANGGPTALVDAPTILASVPSAADCRDATRMPVEIDAAVRATWRRDLVSALGLLRNGDARGALALVDPIVAATADDDALAAEAQRLAAVAGGTARGDDMVDGLRTAIAAAARVHASGVEFAASLDLATALAARGRGPEADDVFRSAETIAQRLPDAELAQGQLLARRAHRERAALRTEDAMASALEARARLVAALGPHHPSVAEIGVSLGLLALIRGDRTAAIEHTCGAERTLVAALGEHDVDVIDAGTKCATTLLPSDPAQARTRLLGLLDRLGRVDHGDDTRRAGVMTHLGIAQKRLGAPAAAATWHRQADALYAAVSPEHPARIATLANLGASLLAAGDPVGSEQAYARATTLADAVHGDRHPETAQTWIGLAEARVAAHVEGGAIEAAERGAVLVRHAENPALHAYANVVLAEALLAGDVELPRAQTLARAAEDVLRARSTETVEYRRTAALLTAIAERIASRSERSPSRSAAR